MAQDMSILGNSVVRREDPRFLTGAAQYVEDLPLVDAAWLTYVRSSYAHGRITGIDTSVAAAMPGVLGVFTAADLDGFGPVPHPLPILPAGTERPVLASDVVRFVGEAIVAVVAEDRALAADAAEAVIVEIDPIEAVVEPSRARHDDVLLFPDFGTNVVLRFNSDGVADFADCEVVAELDIDNQRVHAAPMEPRSGAAEWTSDGRLVHYSACQGAHPARATLCAMYGLPPEQVRVVVPDVGGGFGAKARPGAEELALGWFARAVGRPMRWTETRTESMVSMPSGRGQRQHVTIGGTRDGRITAYQLTVLQDAGAYPMMGAILPRLTMRMLTGVYEIDNVGFSSESVATNTASVTSYRGAGRPEATAAIERSIDFFAAEIGLDPAEVRRRNVVPRFLDGYRTGIGTQYDVGDYAQALQRVLGAADYDALRAEQARRRAAGDTLLMGIGLSVYVEVTAGASGVEYGSVSAQADGRMRVVTGATPFGQGHETGWAMIVSDRTGVPMDHIDIVHGDTDLVPSGGITGGSRSVQVAGSALADASTKLIALARSRAADQLEAAADDVGFDSSAGVFHVAGAPSITVGWAELVDGDEPLTGVSDFEAAQPTFPFGAHLAVVDVDADTGHVTLRRFVAVDDAGTLLNPLLAAGQVHGGIAQGAAQALMEAVRYDDAGNPLTTNFADYPVISAAELPSFELVHMETPTFVNELGAKGIGEAGTIGATPAVHNAVIDALAHLGVRHVDMPLTPERVWRAAREASATARR
jgi:carbon-monoxide dehydrogenase large subunit